MLQNHEKNQLIKEYHKLSTLLKGIIRILGVNVNALSQQNILSVLNSIKLTDEDNKPVNLKTFRVCLLELKNKGLVIQKSDGASCPETLLFYAAGDAAIDNQFKKIFDAIENCAPMHFQLYGRHAIFRDINDVYAAIQFTAYCKDDFLETLHIYMSGQQSFKMQFIDNDPFLKIFNSPFNPRLFDTIKLDVRRQLLVYTLEKSINNLNYIPDLLQYLSPFITLHSDLTMKYKLGLAFLFHGQNKKAVKILSSFKKTLSWQFEVLNGCIQVINNNNKTALVCFNEALLRYKKLTGEKKQFFPGHEGVFFLFALLQSKNTSDHKKGLSYAKIMAHRYEVTGIYALYYNLKNLFSEKLGISSLQNKNSEYYISSMGAIDMFWSILVESWIDLKNAKSFIDKLEKLQRQSAQSGYFWVEAEISALLAILGKKSQKNKNRSDKLHKLSSTTTLTKIITPVSQWEKELQTLINIGNQFTRSKKGDAKKKADREQRLIWIVEYSDKCLTCDLRPRIQTLTKKKNWTKGRAVALKNLYYNRNRTSMAGLSTQDQKICSALVEESYNTRYYYGHKIEYSFDLEKALPALAGHPLVFLETSLLTPVEIIKGEPELKLRVNKNNINVFIHPFPDFYEYANKTFLIRETLSRFKVVCFTKEQLLLSEFISNQGLKFPPKSKKMAIDAMTSLSPMISINSDLSAKKDKTIRSIKADPTPNVHVMPWQEGISLEFLVRPFTSTGSYFKPGRGGKNVFAQIKEKKVQTTRNLDKEKENANIVIEKCPTLDLLEEVDGQWLVGDPEEALELLLELKNCGNSIIMAWPRGEKMKVRSKVSYDDFKLSIKKDREWFKASGTLKIDKNMSIDLNKLMDLLKDSKGHFVTLDDGTFLSITNSLKERLEELKAFSTPHKKSVRFSPLAAHAMEELIDKTKNVTSDKAWKSHLKKINEPIHPEIPGTLQAKLRDYQTSGFNWLFQLAHWNVGACLADDMGLGKTVQALAAILTKAAKGPTLVVAPLSVMANWQEECHKFAPTLNPLVFGSGDRKLFLNNLKPFDIVISSYGLLQIEAQKLAKVEWQTIVLDEAQAIKNMNTKRSKAAMKLNAQFRIITTGTPVENHLNELWTLFNFINPGLLSSINNFKNNFATPIESNHDKKASKRLKKLIQPFILRRLKSDVLKELPQKTHINLKVEMSKKEALLYEAQRLKAIEEIETADDNPGQKHLRILAQLTRLRQLCCNPALVLPNTDIESSKLKVFGNIVDELMENNHKALVFSQFVGHLNILRNFLNIKKINYQYLDGSTPVKKRKKRIDAFQNGDGDLFLISLKAGGFGLNLTAADYVIHMDPWWNPAVEDQASDRAHRIGQTRPVTVYRLVVKNSIEEKIVALHKEKRELANSILTGSDMAGKISADELLTLLHENYDYDKIKSRKKTTETQK